MIRKNDNEVLYIGKRIDNTYVVDHDCIVIASNMKYLSVMLETYQVQYKRFGYMLAWSEIIQKGFGEGAF